MADDSGIHTPSDSPSIFSFVSSRRGRPFSGRLSFPSMMDVGLPTGGVSELYSNYLRVGKYKSDIFKALREVKDYAIVQAILEVMKDDVLAPDENTGEIFSISSDNAQYDAFLKNMEVRLELDELIDDVLYDLLLYGEYPLKVVAQIDEKTGRGQIISLEDLRFPEQILPVYKGRRVIKYLLADTSRSSFFSSSPPTVHAPDNFIMFLRNPESYRSMSDEYVPYLSGGVIKIGKSIFPLETLEKLKALSLMEKMVPIARLQQLDRNTVLGVRLGQTMTLTQALKACREYERYLNTKVSPSDPLDLSSVLSSVGRYKVIPLLGERGSVEEMPIQPPDIGVLSDIQDIRDSILSSVGIFPGYLSGMSPTTESLKSYVRYLRKLQSVQSCIAKALTMLGIEELKLRGYTNVRSRDVKVVFSNLVSIANIERLEFMDILVQLLRGYTEFVVSLNELPGGAGGLVDYVALLKFVHDKLRHFRGAEAAIRVTSAGAGGEETAQSSEMSAEEVIDDLLSRIPKEVLNEAYENSKRALSALKEEFPSI